jgi:hypothetical protein
LTSGRHTISGAPPPNVLSAQAQDDPEEWFLLGLTFALVVRKLRGIKSTDLKCLSRSKHKCSCLPSSEDCKLEIKDLHQHQASRRNTKNWRRHLSTWRRPRPQANRNYPRSLDFSRPQLRAKNLLTYVESFRAY